jgi:hypothetical protein
MREGSSAVGSDHGRLFRPGANPLPRATDCRQRADKTIIETINDTRDGTDRCN